MHAKDLSPQAAANWIDEWHSQIVETFLHCRENLPSWGLEIDRQVHQYVEGLAYWVRGSDDWSFESHRYFGTQGPEIQKTREIYMLPRVDALASRSLTHRGGVEAEKHSIAAMQIRRDLAEDRVTFQTSYA